MKSIVLAAGVSFLATQACAPLPAPDRAAIREQVLETERAFAKTMADRDFESFREFLSEEAVFLSGPAPLRGKNAVAEAWKRYFEDPRAPFSWEPREVEVLQSGSLAWSTGPVRDRDGEVIATFHSIWRLEPPGAWRIVFDKGTEVCPSPGPAESE